jgi:hypothetical protein
MKANVIKRVWAEVEEANADFFNLRTVITPDLIDDDVTRFYFTMIPNDGAMAHLNLVGRFYIPEVSRISETRHTYRCLRPDLRSGMLVSFLKIDMYPNIVLSPSSTHRAIIYSHTTLQCRCIQERTVR